MKYGLICYDYTTNLGNEIQSIAARRFLPKVDHYIEHEKLERFDRPDKVKMIMNGFFVDCPAAWPPSDKIDPLLVSMHFSTTNEKKITAFLSPESKEYFSQHGSVGCRDMHSLNFLNENDIEAHFTGCLTLTLDSGKKKDLQNDDGYIIVNINNADPIISFLKEKTDKKIYRIQQEMIPSFKKAFPGQMPLKLYNLSSYYNYREKFFMAENLLKVYENASCVLTDRLHCALPCLAFKTPVILFNERHMKERFNGLSDLLLESTFEEYQNDYNIFDVDNPPENSDKYLKIRNNLIKTCSDFTGTVNDSCYSNFSYDDLVKNNTLILSRNAIETRQYFQEVLKFNKNLEKSKNKEIKSLKEKNKDQKEKNESLKAKNKNQTEKIESLKAQDKKHKEKIEGLKAQDKKHKEEIKSLKAKIKRQGKIIREMESSRSWRMTRPMRSFTNSFKRK